MRVLLFACVVCALLVPALVAQDAGQSSPPNARKMPPARDAAARGRLQELLSEVGVSVPDEASQVAPSASYRELIVSWQADKARLDALDAEARVRNPAGRFSRSEAARTRRGALPKQRSLELSPDQVLVVAVDAASRMKWWGLTPDPRIVRAEFPGPDGVLTGQTVVNDDAAMLLAYPDDPAITELRLYHPRWTGERFALELIGTLDVR